MYSDCKLGESASYVKHTSFQIETSLMHQSLIQIPDYITLNKSIQWIWGQLKTEYKIPKYKNKVCNDPRLVLDESW